MSKEAILERARKHVEQQMKQAEDEFRRELLRKRLDLVTKGVAAYEKKKYAEAVVNYRAYIRLLEEWKGARSGGLNPTHFDYTKELGDLLMLSGIYWDMAKVYDRTKSKDKKGEFLHYLEKFILFSKGMTWQPMAAETLRKYIRSDRPLHRGEFKNAYKLIGTDQCFVVTSLLDVVEFETLIALRTYRDQRLSRTWSGRIFIRAYYRVGPVLAKAVDRLPQAIRLKMARGLDRLAQKL